MGNTKKLKQMLVVSALLLGMLAIGETNSQAALQANATTHNNPKAAGGAAWIQSIREMEKAGQTMGLNETINADLTPTSSNNIDVHMMKTTEYGAMAILSASGFGYSGKLQDAPVKSTTGNVTGVYVIGTRHEWTAGVCSASVVGKDARYYDLYTTSQTSAKVGDALGLDSYRDNPGCSGWHDSSIHNFPPTVAYGFIRGGKGIFGYFCNTSGSGDEKYGSAYWGSGANYARGVAVVKSGV